MLLAGLFLLLLLFLLFLGALLGLVLVGALLLVATLSHDSSPYNMVGSTLGGAAAASIIARGNRWQGGSCGWRGYSQVGPGIRGTRRTLREDAESAEKEAVSYTHLTLPTSDLV